jgi:hypothetical protein
MQLLDGLINGFIVVGLYGSFGGSGWIYHRRVFAGLLGVASYLSLQGSLFGFERLRSGVCNGRLRL